MSTRSIRFRSHSRDLDRVIGDAASITWLHDPTVWTVVISSAIVGVVAGTIGTIALVRRQSLIGDVIAHASLLGLLGGYLFMVAIGSSQVRHPLMMLTGAAMVGWAAAGLVRATSVRCRVSPDAAMAVSLALFFGGGVTLLRFIQRAHPPLPERAGLDGYLFGMAAATTRSDAVAIAAVGSAALFTLWLVWHRIKWVSLDASHVASLHVNHSLIEGGITLLIVVAIVVGLQTVGVVLMIALLIGPAAIASRIASRLETIAVLAGVIGGSVSALGALASSVVTHLPTGPVIVAGLMGLWIVVLLWTARSSQSSGTNSRKSPLADRERIANVPTRAIDANASGVQAMRALPSTHRGRPGP